MDTARTPTTDELIARLEADLRAARKERDRAAITALRTTLGAIANAEAPPVGDAAPAVVGKLVDHPRLVLTIDDIARLIRHEIDDRHDTVRQYLDHGRVDEADELRAEIAVLQRYAG